MKGLIDRAGFVAMANRDIFQRKVGVAVTVMRRAGAATALDTMDQLHGIFRHDRPGKTGNWCWQ